MIGITEERRGEQREGEKGGVGRGLVLLYSNGSNCCMEDTFEEATSEEGDKIERYYCNPLIGAKNDSSVRRWP